MDFNIQTLFSLCIINSFICFVIYFTISKNKKNLKPSFFGLCLEKDINDRRKSMTIYLNHGYYLHINNILPGDYYDSIPLILKIQTKKINKKIFVYRGNPNDWKPYIDLKFGEDDEYVTFEYNTRAFLSGIYIPI